MEKFCAGCGAPLDEKNAFCTVCGRQRGQTVTEETPSESTAEVMPWDAPAENAAEVMPWDAPAENAPEAQPWDAPSESTTEAQPCETPSESTTEAQPWETPAPAWTQPADGEAMEEETPPWAVPGDPREKKPLPKWVIPVVAVVAVVIAGVAVIRSFHTPQRTAEQFLEALEAGDAEAVAKVTVLAGEDEEPLTGAQLEPLVRLYEKDEYFRTMLNDLMDTEVERMEDAELDAQEGSMFTMQGKKNILYTDYDVVVDTCDTVNFHTNLEGDLTVGTMTVTMERVNDESIAQAECYGTLEDVLPGYYEIKGSVTTDYGVTVTGESVLTVTDYDSTDGELLYEYRIVEVYNDSNVPMELMAGDNATMLATVDPRCSYYVGPVLEDTPMQARAVAPLAKEQPVVEFDGSEHYRSVQFDLSTLELQNNYGFPMQVYRGDELVLELDAYSGDTLIGLEKDCELTFTAGPEGVLQPAIYVTESSYYNYFVPAMYLTPEMEEGVKSQVVTHLQEIIALYNGGNLAGLQAMEETSSAAEYWREELEELQEDRADEGSYSYYSAMDTASMVMDRWDVNVLQEEVGSMTEGNIGVNAYFSVSIPCTYNYVYSDGDINSSDTEIYRYVDVYLEYVDGQWVVAA